MEMRCRLLTSSPGASTLGSGLVLQPSSPSKANSDSNTSTRVRNGRTGNGTRHADNSVFPHGPSPKASGLSVMITYAHWVSVWSLRVGFPVEEHCCYNWWGFNHHVVASVTRKGSPQVTEPQVPAGK